MTYLALAGPVAALLLLMLLQRMERWLARRRLRTPPQTRRDA